jgi:NADPH:quinone reductase
MKAAWYEKQGPAREVLVVGEMPEPIPAAGEVRIRIAASGINPGDIKKRQNAFAYGMPYPRVIPHSDGAGRVDQLGAGVPSEWTGRSVWCYGASRIVRLVRPLQGSGGQNPSHRFHGIVLETER